MKFVFYLFILLSSPFLFAQLNIDSLSHINYQTLHNANLNDVWGYVDELGNEYAIVGTTKGTSIVDVTNPSNPVEVFWIPGTESIWRDPSVYGDYAYVTTEAHDGLLIIDLSPLPASTALSTTFYTGLPGSELFSAHTCFVDENGYCYVFGSNKGNGGALILDVQTDPMNPVEVGFFDNWYVHDGFVRNDTMYLAHISDGFFSLVDVSDKANPVLIGTQSTPNDFTHNIWPSDNGQFVFTTDEVAGAYVAAYDISDPFNIVEVDRIQNSPGQGVLPHNTHVLNNFIVTSYYSDGITIHDITHPNNIIKVGGFDTYPSQTTSFDGCWGVYPFLPSGTILASDITQGLFILGPAYVQASYLEGLVTDALTTNPVGNVEIQISGNDQTDHSLNSGLYATGILGVGNYDVTYSKVGYFSQTINVSLTQGSITFQDVQLVPIPPFNLTVNVVESGTGIPISNAQIVLTVPLLNHSGITNGIGQEDFTLYYQQNYLVTVGKWGYFTKCYEQLIDQNTTTLTIEMDKGYQDEFTFDFGWIVSGTATTGVWERGDPFGSDINSAPSDDADYDCGINAYVTGNDEVIHPDLDDVDNGTALLISPTMDLLTYSDPYLNYARWFFCKFGAPPDDTLKISVSNGFTSVVVDQIGPDETQFSQWIPKSIRLLDFIALTNSMQVSFFTSDLNSGINVTEAGVDYFYISNSNVLENDQLDLQNPKVYPNPVDEVLNIEYGNSDIEYFLFDLHGKEILQGRIISGKGTIDTSFLDQGVYLLKMNNSTVRVMKD